MSRLRGYIRILLLFLDERILILGCGTLYREFQRQSLHLIDRPESFFESAEARVTILDFESENVEFIERLFLYCLEKVDFILWIGEQQRSISYIIRFLSLEYVVAVLWAT